LAVGGDRLRAYALQRQRERVLSLSQRGSAADGGVVDRGAFVVVQRDDAPQIAERMRAAGIDVDARGPWLRLCPDVLTTSGEIARAADVLAGCVR